ncbi:MAG: 50S ribosomal protein L35 [Gammaproteobacteria bacterium]|nr:50S ribosomal protein L35 [Gammaproteobacteria bacterium]
MPKMKTASGAGKRFRVTGKGRIKRYQSHRSHILTKKSTKRKRQLRTPESICDSDVPRVRRMLGIG